MSTTIKNPKHRSVIDAFRAKKAANSNKGITIPLNTNIEGLNIDEILAQPIKKIVNIKKRQVPLTDEELKLSRRKKLYIQKKQPISKVDYLYSQYITPYNEQEYKGKRKVILKDPITGDYLSNNKKNRRDVNKNIEIYNKKITKQLKKLDIKTITNYKNTLKNLKDNETTYFNIPQTGNIEAIKSFLEAIIETISYNKKVVLFIDNTGYTINDSNRYKLLSIILNSLDRSVATTGSDMELVEAIKTASRVGVRIYSTTKFLKNGKQKSKQSSGFFHYYNKTSYDLSRYQIFKDYSDTLYANGDSKYIDNCLVYALDQLGLDSVKLHQFKTMCRTREIPQCALKKLCEETKIQINLKTETANRTKLIYGKSTEQYNLASVDKHYFIDEEIPITLYSIKNYNEVKDLENWNFINKKQGKYYKKDLKYTTSTFSLIKAMIENKDQVLEVIDKTHLMDTQYSNKVDEITTLDYLDCDTEEVLTDKQKEEKKERERKPNKTNKTKKEKSTANKYTQKVFFDIETDPTGKIHEPFLIVSRKFSDETIIGRFQGENCVLDFLKSLKENTLLIAHNAGGYDASFLCKYLYQYKEICRDNDVMQGEGVFYNYTIKDKCKCKIYIKIKDSLKLINMALKQFPECFFTKEEAKTIKKEVMPYNLYTQRNIQKKFVDIQEGVAILKRDKKNTQKDIDQFLKNINEWSNVKKENETFDILEYSYIYCLQDVNVLYKGYETFRGWMQTLTGYDVDNVISLASLSDKHLINQGCYEGVYSLAGIPQLFIMKCVVGGRTMTRDNKRFKCEKIVQDFDAVSLYPSGMVRLGLLKGIPKVIQNDELTYQQLKKYDGFFIECVATSIKTKRDFPLLSYVDENGIRNFTNDVVGKTFHLDKTMFEDAMEFQGITFDIKRGYYYNDGFNYKIQEVIKNMFNERVTKKKEGNPIQLAYKELLNCAYGKTILKASENEYKFFDNKEALHNYISLNYNFISEIHELNEKKTRVKVMKSIAMHFNRPQVGVSILSMSKRIMNEVMCLAEDNNFIINYQDTDSMHILDHQVKPLGIAFQEKYNRVLIGDDLGQFHSDFELKYEDNNGVMQKAVDIVSIQSIYLGKKCYNDVLVGRGKDNCNLYMGSHTRLKGVSSAAIEHYMEAKGLNTHDLFKIMLEGKETITYDLLCKDEKGYIQCTKFEKCKNKTIKNRSNFTRDISFERVKLVEYKDLL